MFPPLDKEVLSNNPNFAQLYATLKASILNAEGASRFDADVEEPKIVPQELEARRLKHVKQYLLERVIATATPFDDQTSATRRTTQGDSEELLDLITLLQSLFEANESLSSEATQMLLSSPPLSRLGSLLPELSALVSSHLYASAAALTRIIRPTTNTSITYRQISSVATDLSRLQGALSQAQTDLAHLRLRTSSSLVELSNHYTEGTNLLIGLLEARHGPLARSLELRALKVSLLAQRTETEVKQAASTVRREVYSPELVSALENYHEHLKDAKIRAAERVKVVRRRLEEYGVGVDNGQGKETMMRDMARTRRDLGHQIEELTQDLQRLETS